jgi:UDP-N-acetylmuramoylalanine--D-glutamate ligase
MIPVSVFQGRRVAVFGLGISGIASSRALAAGGADVAAWDDSEIACAEAARSGIPIADIREADWSAFSALVLAPGVPLTDPEPHWSVKVAQSAGVEIIGDTELFLRERERQGSGARVIGITGTNGKSTTAALLHHLLGHCGRKSALGGNIGTAILDLQQFADDLTYVVELSSYQIDLTPTLRLDSAALLNITPDHLERHGNFERYAKVKARIFSGLGPDGCAVIGIDDAECRAIADQLNGPYQVARISTVQSVDDGVYAREGELIAVRDGAEAEPISCLGIASLRGQHNWQNAAAAAALAMAEGLGHQQIQKGLQSFPGLAHRMEDLGRLGQVVFVNDSKATNVMAAAKALACFDQIYWIAGGRAKEDGIEELEKFFPRIRRAYLIGEAADSFAGVLEGKVDYVIAGTIDAAVQAAARDSAQSTDAGPVVLLSPACASFDQFPSFYVRGDAFRKTVGALSGIQMRERRAA